MALSNFEMGFVIAAVPMAVAGMGFAISVSASPFVATIGKALGWPLSIILGYIGAVHWGAEFFPYWQPWASRTLMFGPGFFFTWMTVGVIFQEEMIVREIELATYLFKKIKALISETTVRKPAQKYKAYAPDVEED